MGAGDSFTPDTGQRVDAQGHVTYDFTGHISAVGLDLTATEYGAGSTPAPPDDNKVRWLRASDGSLVADVFGAYSPAGSGLPESRGAWVDAGTAPRQSPDGGQSRRLVLDQNGRSGYVQTLSTVHSRQVAMGGVIPATFVWSAFQEGIVASVNTVEPFGNFGVIVVSLVDSANAFRMTVSWAATSNQSFDIAARNPTDQDVQFGVSWLLLTNQTDLVS